MSQKGVPPTRKVVMQNSSLYTLFGAHSKPVGDAALIGDAWVTYFRGVLQPGSYSNHERAIDALVRQYNAWLATERDRKHKQTTPGLFDNDPAPSEGQT